MNYFTSLSFISFHYFTVVNSCGNCKKKQFSGRYWHTLLHIYANTLSNKTAGKVISLTHWRRELKSTDDTNESSSLQHNFSFELKMERFMAIRMESYIAFFAKIQRYSISKSTSVLCSFSNPIIFPIEPDVWLFFTGLPGLRETFWSLCAWSRWQIHNCNCTSKPEIIESSELTWRTILHFM